MKISKTKIKTLENKLKKLEEDNLLDKSILDRISKEKSLLGQQLLICDHIRILSGRTKDKEAASQVTLLLLRLLKNNISISESLESEIKEDNKLLKKRIDTMFKSKNIHSEIYKNMLKVATKHMQLSKHHFSKIDKKDKKTHHHAKHVVYHKDRANELFDLLLHKKVKKVTKTLAMTKLSEVYEILLKKSEKISKLVDAAIKKIDSKKKAVNELYLIHKEAYEQNLELKQFAGTYSRSLVHTAEYVDSMKNKIVLYN